MAERPWQTYSRSELEGAITNLRAELDAAHAAITREEDRADKAESWLEQAKERLTEMAEQYEAHADKSSGDTATESLGRAEGIWAALTALRTQRWSDRCGH